MTSNNMNLVDRVVDRLQKQPIGDLITTEDLHDIVKEAIPKVFFQERKVKRGYHEETLPPLILEAIEKVLKAHMEDAVEKWAAENAQMMVDKWKEIFDKSIMTYAQDLISKQSNTQVRHALEPLLQQLNNERMKLGLPSVYFNQNW